MNGVEVNTRAYVAFKITSTLGLLVRGDPQNEGLRGLQPRALGSKLDYFHAGITSTRLHRTVNLSWEAIARRAACEKKRNKYAVWSPRSSGDLSLPWGAAVLIALSMSSTQPSSVALQAVLL